MNLKSLLSKLKFDTYGNIASSSFIVATISGILLAIPFDINNSYKSISEMILLNPLASIVRGIHYWSAQFFLIFTILHIWEHLKKNGEKKIKSGIWFRLFISVFFSFYVMLSGFLLKNDVESNQAYLILETLFNEIPLIGKYLSYLFLGGNENLQIVYMNHIATSTIFLAIVIIEHAKYFWTKLKTFLIVTFLSFLPTLFLIPNLHDGNSPLIKGPWYFVGLQEILHHFSNPVYILSLLSLGAFLFYYLKHTDISFNRNIKKLFFYTFNIYLLFTFFGLFFRGENWELKNPFQSNQNEKWFLGSALFPGVTDSLEQAKIVNNRVEGCLNCHENTKGFSESHNPEAIGCSSCHLGNPFTLNKERAHENMIMIPGNLDNVRLSCGKSNCHSDIVHRIDNSIMKTNSGIVSVNKYVFEELDSPEGFFEISELGNSTAAESHLSQLCSGCHLGIPKSEYGKIDELSRGGGCNACHLNYSKEAISELKGKKNEKVNSFHPSLSLKIGNEHCFGCHSRSGRISTNYEGWHETQLDTAELEKSEGKFRVLMDGRVFSFVQSDIHFQKGLECIDCHLAVELMGDGKLYEHSSEQTKLRCEDCHTSEPEFTTKDELDGESLKIIKLRKIKTEKFLVTSKGKIPILNTLIKGDSLYLISKDDDDLHKLKEPAKICSGNKAHESLSCNSCHTAWSPQCIGCHTEFNPDAKGYDHLERIETDGAWEEHIGLFLSDYPTLGVRENKGFKKIETFVPGMVLTVDKEEFGGGKVFKRLFSPTVSHTTSSKGRSCKSCHNNPLALGYGRGKLEFIKEGDSKGKWNFVPMFERNYNDNLPEDAWIPFLTGYVSESSTRTDTRPFTVEEQQKILKVGTCLTCHEENSSITVQFLVNFEKSLNERSSECLVPVF